MRTFKIALMKTPGAFDAPLFYALPSGLRQRCRPGCLVKIPLRNRISRGILIEEPKELPAEIPVSKVRAIESAESLTLGPLQMGLARFLVERYGCSWVRALRLFFPRALWEGRLKPPSSSEVSGVLKLPLDFLPALSSDQKQAWQPSRDSERPVLLQASKRDRELLYLHAIAETLARQKQVLICFPEIFMASSFLKKLQIALQGRMVLFHSGLPESERLKNWWRVYRGEADLLIGSRSAIFAPLSRPGLIIIDEEQDEAFQSDSLPHYEVPVLARKLAKDSGARLILGSFTPRLSSDHQARLGELVRIRLPIPLLSPALIVDLKEERQKRNFSLFSGALQRAITESLKKKERVLLFLNQRGMARGFLCRECGKIEECPHCHIPLKFHQPGTLRCHSCVFKKAVPARCEPCGSSFLKGVGFGTHKAEEEARRFFPQARLLRADRDTASTAFLRRKLEQQIKAGDYDILIGTEMVLKEFPPDFSGLLSALLPETDLEIPDYRASEWLFFKLARLRLLGSPMVIQTCRPDHFVIRCAARLDYEGFSEEERRQRKSLAYPPFS